MIELKASNFCNLGQKYILNELHFYEYLNVYGISLWNNINME